MITLDQAITRCRNGFEIVAERNLRALQTRLLLDDVHPDDIDDMLDRCRQHNARAIEEQITLLRAEFASMLPEGHQGRAT